MELDPVPRRRLLRVVVVAAEVVGAIALAGLAWWCWRRGVIVTVRRGVVMNRIDGRWWTIATAVATLAGILLLDAGRRIRGHAVLRPDSDPAPALSP